MGEQGTQGSRVVSLSWGDEAGSLGVGAQSDQVCRADYQRRDLYRERTLKTCKMISLMSSAEY